MRHAGAFRGCRSLIALSKAGLSPNTTAILSIVFLQPFGLGTVGGGPRILRALLQDAPVPWTSVACSPSLPQGTPFGQEVHIPTRPSFGRLERSRLHPWCQSLEPIFAGMFRRRLQAVCQERDTVAIHSIPTDLDFIQGWRVAQRLGCKFFVSVHDDLVDTVGRHPFGHLALKLFPEIWRGADARFVISEQLGREYCRRYSEQSFQMITDGIEGVHPPRARPAHRLNIYFMGLFHIRYSPNLSALFAAVEKVRVAHPGLEIRVRMRCGLLPSGLGSDFDGLDILPSGSESDVEADMDTADLLYLPLPFGEENAAFVRHSLSTKMITYLGAGLPIFYHGPQEAAACDILSEGGAAVTCNSLVPDRIADTLTSVLDHRGVAEKVVSQAAVLASQISARRSAAPPLQ